MLGIVTRAGIPGAKLCCSLAEEVGSLSQTNYCLLDLVLKIYVKKNHLRHGFC